MNVPMANNISSNEQKYSAIIGSLLNAPFVESYWARRARMLTLEAELSPLDYKLLDFDVAFKYSHAKDLARSAQKLFQTDKSNDKVRQRIGQLFSVLLNTADRQFSTELVTELSMEVLQEMFFFAYPEQRNSTKGSLQVYLVCASNIPKSLATIATKLFAYYLGTSAEFQRKPKGQQTEEDITPMDAVLFQLFESLQVANFGDLSIHNVSQIFQILLRNCFADTMGRVPEDFYGLSGIPCLAGIARPSASWHFCLHTLAHLFHQRGQNQLAKALEPMPKCSSEMAMALENAMAHPEQGPALLQSAEFVRLVLCWAMASPIRHAQNDAASQMISVPANLFWVDPSGLEHYWMYRLDANEEDSPAEIEEIPHEKTLRISPHQLRSPIHLLNTLFSTVNPSDKELAQLGMPNAQSILLLALMASENWKRAAELLERFESATMTESQREIFFLQKLQLLINLRKLGPAFTLCLQLLSKFGLKIGESFGQQENLPDFPAVIVAKEPVWIQLGHAAHLPLYLLLLLFHICWLAYAKCQAGTSAKQVQSAELLFFCLILLAQACWEPFGFGLFQQLAEHVAKKERFRCPGLLSRVANSVLLGQLLVIDVPMDITPVIPECTSNFKEPSQIFKEIVEGKLSLAGERTPSAILENFLAENGQRICEILNTF